MKCIRLESELEEQGKELGKILCELKDIQQKNYSLELTKMSTEAIEMRQTIADLSNDLFQ